ncbi:MAG: thymidine kinase [Candidatus Paceibacterota bacterium]
MKNNINTITIYCGSMFSGKTTALRKDLELFKIAGFKTVIFKHSFDVRDGGDIEKTHDGTIMPATMVQNSEEILKHIDNVDIIGIDEVHFFDNNLGNVVKRMITMGKTVVASGLDMDFMGEPFYNTIYLMGIADNVNKMHGVCVACGGRGKYNHKFAQCSNDRLEVGAEDKYKCLCYECIKNEFKTKNKIF